MRMITVINELKANRTQTIHWSSDYSILSAEIDKLEKEYWPTRK
jgi:hypothetical protein